MQIDNQTPFVADHLTSFDLDGAECVVVLLKATYELSFREAPRIHGDQTPLAGADVYAGAPGRSGLLIEGEYTQPKPATDVFLSGHAVPRSPGARFVDVVFQVADRLQQARVYGERHWLGALGIYWMTRPEPLGRVPLTWENTYGGTDETPPVERFRSWVEDNPAGAGFFAVLSQMQRAESRVPNIVDPGRPYLRPRRPRARPVGFLPVAPGWPLRSRYAGTYDARWQREQAPLLPLDFDDRFLLASPPGLRGETRLRGGEPCLVAGTRAEGDLRFFLPKLTPVASLRFARSGTRLPLLLDTVHVDTDALRLHLVFRGRARAHGLIDEYESVELRLESPRVAA